MFVEEPRFHAGDPGATVRVPDRNVTVLTPRTPLNAPGFHDDQIPLLFELSQLHATRLRDSQKAIAGFLQILDFEPDHLPTIDALEVLRRADPSSALAVMRGLLPYYRSVRDHLFLRIKRRFGFAGGPTV